MEGAPGCQLPLVGSMDSGALGIYGHDLPLDIGSGTVQVSHPGSFRYPCLSWVKKPLFWF